MKKYYKILIIIILFFSVVFLAWHKPVLAPEVSQERIKVLRIGGAEINAEIADTREKQTKGLSGYQTLPENQGMLFVFSTPGYYSFWMKDMNFSLDFIWISGDEIVEITKNVRPEDYQPPSLLVSKSKVNKVLEVNAGVAERLGIQEGDGISF